MTEEIWKDIKDYEGYMVSNLGRVKSLERYDKLGHLRKEKLLSTYEDSSNHLLIGLIKNGKRKIFPVHVLVAKAFLENNECLSLVHHIDENPHNNNVNNLMWVSVKEHMFIHHSKPINQFTIDNKFVKTWDSAIDINKELGLNRGCISECCKGKRKQAYGYKWKYAEE